MACRQGTQLKRWEETEAAYDVSADGLVQTTSGQLQGTNQNGIYRFCSPGVKHWHGGSADTTFAHIAVNTNPQLTGLEWFDRISEEEYAQLAAE